MVRHAVITGVGLPVVRPFALELLRQQVHSLTLCSDCPDFGLVHEEIRACQQQQAPKTELQFCTFSGRDELTCLDGALRCRPNPLLLHGRTRRCLLWAETNPCDAVHQNLLLTRQVLQLALVSTPASFVFLSSDLALQTASVLGASLAAAEASVLEAARLLFDMAIAVVRFPSSLDPIRLDGLSLDRAWRQERASRAALQAISTNRGHVLLSWPDPVGAPQQLQSQSLAQAITPPHQPLLGWLQRHSHSLQTYDNAAVASALLDLWGHPPAPQSAAAHP
jgi:hypothetical protein